MHPAIFALKRAYQETRNNLEAQLHGRGLTASQMDVLKLLLPPDQAATTTPPPCVDQRALQTALGVSSATLTRLLAGMERRQLVKRAPHPTDLRGKTVSITPEAARLFAALMAEGEAAFNARLLRGFSPEEVATLVRMLERVAGNMSTRPTDAPR